MNSVKLELGPFARSGLAASAGGDIELGVRRALAHLAAKVGAGRPPVPPPTFLPAAESAPDDLLEVDVDREVVATLEREARRCGVSFAAIAAHAAMVYLAELESLDAIDVGPMAPRALGQL